ncbi:phasin family protein [Olsenella massiliensis]|uniref:phasin family protein n=1 Tax=Olsenella massiliensis TaxID=1622075 RepID=UPI00071D8D64|nr:phasin family protein [Olsenella massiliensis]
MANFDDVGEGVRKVFLAGVGALAMGAERSQKIVEDLVKKGELTVEQGKALNEELMRKVHDASQDGSDALMRAKLRSMGAEERAAWLDKLRQMSDELDAQGADADPEEASDEPEVEDPDDDDSD